jgi:hypothetical protein
MLAAMPTGRRRCHDVVEYRARVEFSLAKTGEGVEVSAKVRMATMR